MQNSRNEFEESKKIDLRDSEVPDCLYWSVDQVCDFFDNLNLPEYKETIRSNNIDGRRLIYLDANHLSKLGIQDFQHILHITKSVRELIDIEKPYWNRSISFLPKEPLELYLEAKSFNGSKADNLNYAEFKKNIKDAKWQPPLTNQGFIMPSY